MGDFKNELKENIKDGFEHKNKMKTLQRKTKIKMGTSS
jgi:hypothetical protein